MAYIFWFPIFLTFLTRVCRLNNDSIFNRPPATKVARAPHKTGYCREHRAYQDPAYLASPRTPPA